MLSHTLTQWLRNQAEKWIEVLVILALLFCALVNGGTFFAMRRTIADGAFPIYGASALRISSAAGIYLLLWRMGFGRGTRITAAQVKCLVIGGVTSSLSHIALYHAAQTMEGGPTNAILAMTPFLAGLLASRTKLESISRKSWNCKLLCAAGVVLLTVARHQTSGDAQTLGEVGIATFLFAICNFYLKKQDAPIAVQGSIFFLAGMPVIWVVHLSSGDSLPGWPPPLPQTLWLLLTIFVASGLSFALYLWLMQRMKLMNVMSIAFIQPVVGLAIDACFERNPPTLSVWLSVGVIALGLALHGLVKDAPLPAPEELAIPHSAEPGRNGAAGVDGHMPLLPLPAAQEETTA
jgi:drug/metabolite transporter (DMT)-like permease